MITELLMKKNKPIQISRHHNPLLQVIMFGIVLLTSMILYKPTLAQTAKNANESTSYLRGKVYDAQQVAVANASVAMFNADTSYRTKSDIEGDFMFWDIDTGTYTIEAYIPADNGYLKRGLVKNVIVNDSEKVFVRVTLSKGISSFPYIEEYKLKVATPIDVIRGRGTRIENKIEMPPYRNTNEILLTVPGVYQNR